MIKDLLSQRDLNFAQREQLEKLRKRATFRRDHSNRCKTAAKLDSWTGNADDISPTREEMYKLKIDMAKDFRRAGLTESL